MSSFGPLTGQNFPAIKVTGTLHFLLAPYAIYWKLTPFYVFYKKAKRNEYKNLMWLYVGEGPIRILRP